MKARRFELPDTPGQALHERLATSIQGAITAGQFRPGERLPTHRALAREFDVAIGTVTKAVEALTRQGVVRGEVGRGTFVTEPERPGPTPAVVDLSINALLPVLPQGVFEAVVQRASGKALGLPAGGYTEPAGSLGQRAVLATWLSRSRVALQGEDLIPVVGGQQGIATAFADLRATMGAVATEPATFTGAIAAARWHGLTLLPVETDAEGMLPDALDRVLRGGEARAVYTAPVCQSPLGFETGRARREAIVEVCRKREAFIVEDDVYGAFATSGIPTYKELAPDLTYYVNSLSKLVTPLLRLGVLAPPRGRRPAVMERLRAETWSAPPLSIAAACELIEGEHDVGARTKLREEAEVRLGLAREILGGLLPGDARPGPHVWLPMPLAHAEQFARRAVERGVRLTPPSAPLLDPTQVSGVRLCLLSPRQRPDLARALRSLAEAVSEPGDIVV